MSKKITLSFAFLIALIGLGFNTITSHAMGFTPDDPYPTFPGIDTASALYDDVDEMADRIVDTEEEILIMADQIVETEEIVATVSTNDGFNEAALNASDETRETMDLTLIENPLPENELDTDNADENLITELSDETGEMADNILYTEGEIGEMADRIVETEEILADMANGEEVVAPEETDSENPIIVEASDDTSTDSPEDTTLALANDIDEMADRILYTEEEIGLMADNIVETEYLLAETAQDLDTTPTITTDDAEIAPELIDHTLEQIEETTPSTETVTDAVPYESMEVIQNDDGASQEDSLILADDIGEMADNILETEGDIGTTADTIVETEEVLADSLLTLSN